MFYNSDTGKPFENCLVCNCNLLEEDTLYLVERAIKKYNALETSSVIFEYAMCMSCAMRMNEVLSEESKNKVEAYFAQHVNMHQRIADNKEQYGTDVNKWVEHCMLKNTHESETEEYQLYGMFSGNTMLFTEMPYMLSGEAMDEITNLMSNKSLGDIDDFIDQFFGLPPEVRDAIKNSKGILV